MSRFRLTNRARRDILNIGRYTESIWGREKRVHYLTMLDKAFHDLAQEPGRGRACDYIREGYRNCMSGWMQGATCKKIFLTLCVGAAFLFAMLSQNVMAAKANFIDPALCNALVKHVPAPDVEYQPGVDVEGNPVAPADLPGQPRIKLPEKIHIPLTVSLAKVLHLDTLKYPWNQLGPGTEAQLGTLTVEGDQVSFNGQPLTDEQQDNLAVLCMGPRE
ncbi:MAG: type II toxin-antitoxin system RelE/ParE family toxin [Bdellovibrionales bacterium]